MLTTTQAQFCLVKMFQTILKSSDTIYNQVSDVTSRDVSNYMYTQIV
jgi:hypothetical protein